jgi:hypothetical protein
VDFQTFFDSFNITVLLLGAGMALGLGLLFLVVKWLIGDKQATPAQSGAGSAPTRGRLTGLSWVIATTHRSTSQTIGLIMSFASLIAIVLSVICAVAGVTIIAYERYGNLALSAIAALATLILAVIIESISINSLKNIRLSNEAISLAEQAHYGQIVKQMEEQFEEDTQLFAKIDHQKLTKEEMEAMKRAAKLKHQARKEFEKKRHSLMRQQTRDARRTRNASIPFAVVGVLFSASAGGLFWHTVLASLELWLNISIGTMFALVVSVTFVQSELLKRIKDDAIKESLQSGEMQSVMLKKQSEDMVLEMVVDSMNTVKQDPVTLIEMGQSIKEELKTTIQSLTHQTTSRLVEDTGDSAGDKVPQTVLVEKQKPVAKKQKKEPEWLVHPALNEVLKRYPKLNEKVASWRTAGRVSISILALQNATSHSKRIIQNRIKDGTLQVSSHNSNLVLLNSVLDWLRDVEVPVKQDGSAPISDPVTETIPVSTEAESPLVVGVDGGEQTNESDQLLTDFADFDEESNSEWKHTLALAIEALRNDPDITEVDLGQVLGIHAAGIVRFWKVKARSILESEQETTVAQTEECVSV